MRLLIRSLRRRVRTKGLLFASDGGMEHGMENGRECSTTGVLLRRMGSGMAHDFNNEYRDTKQQELRAERMSSDSTVVHNQEAQAKFSTTTRTSCLLTFHDFFIFDIFIWAIIARAILHNQLVLSSRKRNVSKNHLSARSFFHP